MTEPYLAGSLDGFQEGRRFERERIFALLEAWVADDNGDFDKTLALIKGEQN